MHTSINSLTPSAEGQFDSMLYGVLRSQWGHTPNLKDCYYTSLAGGSGGGGESKESEGKEGESNDSKELCRLSAEEFKPLVQQGLHMYEREEKELNMLLFPGR